MRRRKIVSLILAVVMVAGCIPASVWAEEPDSEATEVTEVAESTTDEDIPEEDDTEVTEPEAGETEATEPEVTEPEVTEPEQTEPEETQPEETQPEETQPGEIKNGQIEDVEITADDEVKTFEESNDELPPVSYVEREFDEASNKVVEYGRTCTDYIKVSSLTDNGSIAFEAGKWYVVDKNCTINNRITVAHTSNLILVDGKKLTCNNGIAVTEEGEIRIYGQQEDAGMLYTETDFSGNSPLGGNNDEKAGKITIYGGCVDSLSRAGHGAAIGGGNAASPGYDVGSPYWVKIYGGKVTAYSDNYSAGIGGGKYGSATWGQGIFIYGGDVDSYGTEGAGIGDGPQARDSGGSINIYGGNVKAEGYGTGAGIGGGYKSKNCDLNIHGGVVIAKATGSQKTGAGIGAGSKANQYGQINISGGMVLATSLQGAGIGGGAEADGGVIHIDGGFTVGSALRGGAGIGGGWGGDGAHVTINDGYVVGMSGKYDDSFENMDYWVNYAETAQTDIYGEGVLVILAWLYDVCRDSEICGAGIGGGYEGNGNTLIINGGIVSAGCGYSGACAIGWGKEGDDGGTVYVYPESKFTDNEQSETPYYIDPDSNQMVKSDDNPTANAYYVDSSERMAKLHKQSVIIIPCDHADPVYTYESVTSHSVDCRHCGKHMRNEAHTFIVDSECTRCGTSTDSFFARFYEQTTGGEVIYTDKHIHVGSRFVFPQPFNFPEGKDFVGWKNVVTGEIYFAGAGYVFSTADEREFEAVYDSVTTATYIDAKGESRTVRARIITPETVCFSEGWYVADPALASTSISINEMRYHGNVKLILADGSELKINAPELLHNIDGSDSFTIYGQSAGSGSLEINYASFAKFTQYSCKVSGTLLTHNGTTKLNGGEYHAVTGIMRDLAIFHDADIHIETLNVFDELRLGWDKGDVSIKYDAVTLSGDGYVNVEEGKIFTDGEKQYSGTLSSDEVLGARGKTLTAYNASGYGDPEWVWADDNSSASAVFPSLTGGESMTVDAEVTHVTDTSKITYTAVAEFMGGVYTKTKVVPVKWNIYVAGVQVTGNNYTDVLHDGSVSYDLASNTLNIAAGTVIEGAATPDGKVCGIRYSENMSQPFTVRAEGKCDIKVLNGEQEESYGILSESSLAVYGGSDQFNITVSGLNRRCSICCNGQTLWIDGNMLIYVSGVSENSAIKCKDLVLPGSKTVWAANTNSPVGYALNASSVDMMPYSYLQLDSLNKCINEDCEIKSGALTAGATVQDDKGYYGQWDGVTNLSAYREVRFPNTIRPAGYSLTLDGALGLNIFLDMSSMTDEEKQASYMTFSITGTGTCTEQDDFDPNFTMKDPKTGAIYHGFTCRINSVQMADMITFRWYYKNTCRFYAFSVKEYLDYFDSHSNDYNAKTITLVHALADYGHYVQPYLSDLNGWTIGKDHARMPDCYQNPYDFQATVDDMGEQTASVSKTTGDIKGSTFSLRLDSTLTVEEILVVTEGTVVECNDYPVKKLDDGRYMITVSDISAKDLDKQITITAYAGEGNYRVTFTPLCYLYSVLKGSRYSVACKNAMCSLYYYHRAAKNY